MKKLLIITALLFFSTQAEAYYNIADDWSNSINPNGVWSYNEGNNPLPYNIAGWPTEEFGPTQSAWAHTGEPADGFTPAWFKSSIDPNSVPPISPENGPYDWKVGDVIVHTTSSPPHGADHGNANVTWTSPVSGLFNIDGGLWAGRDIDRGNNWTLWLDDLVLAQGNVSSGDIYSRANPNSFLIEDLYISLGSKLKLELERTTGPQGAGDFVGVNFTVANAVPEPATMLLFGTALAGAFIRRKYS